ncbi:hypothetical protein KUTeg_020519 [Tegillarca granosa]|uniref:TRUD domain-containing protein n=1 Tax=Tegillarca granosa TaxID=220873 RepID=A0ABQ9ECC4_TEGGR|nr:hypothetical protein KUTeg_020519 [Tegillarca granosa]
MEPATKKPKLEDNNDGKLSGDINSSDDVPFLKEKDVGICEYINSLPGFHAVLKQRYSDFIVNEIDKSGNVVHLTSKEYIPEEKPVEEKPVEESISGEVHSLTDTQRQAIDDGILTETDIEKLQGLVASENKKESVILKKKDINDKERRTQIHSSIRKCFTGLESSTTEYEGEKVIKVEKTSGGGGRSRNRYFNPWPADREDFCKFVLYKTAKDTMNAIWLIAKQLKCNHSLFNYAGTKDKRAKTTQEVTAYRITAEKLAGLNKSLVGIVLGNFRALLQNNYKKAVELILKPRPGEDDLTTSSRKIWTDTRDAREVLKKMPKRCTVERALLEGLLKEGENFSNALTRVPRGTRLMYLHSYQSYIWNSSEEIEDGDRHIGSWYTSMLKEDNLTPECFRHKNKSYALPGDYRKIVIQPQDVSWQTYMYNDVNCSLAMSDLDILENVPEPQSDKDGKFKALKIEMSLPASCYATMGVREILKCETSSAYQKKGNDPSYKGSDVEQSHTTQSEKT